MVDSAVPVTKILNGKFKSEDSLELEADILETQAELRNLFPEVFKNG